MAVVFGVLSGQPKIERVRHLLRRLLRQRQVAIPGLLKDHFDPKFYCESYPDVRKSGIDPLLHYFRWGAAEGRNPTSYFDTRSYVAEMGDHIPVGVNPFLHFLQTVGPPDRTTSTQTIISRAELLAMQRQFDLDFYISYNKLYDCSLNSHAAGLLHYIDYGWRQGFDPSPGFSTQTYLDDNPDIALSGINPLLHYVSAGLKEGRKPLPPRFSPAASLDLPAELRRAVRQPAAPSLAPELRNDVAIIVPVFNASDDLADLLESLAASVAPEQRILLIDDASTDPAIPPMLEEFAADRPGTSCVRHQTNKGFSAGVNAGVAANPGSHVVVLNSDLVLPPGWLSRLLWQIDQSPETVASVTPFSNTSSLTGFPESAFEGPLYGGHDLQVLDGVFRRMPTCGIDLPSACGFCMVLSVAALEKIGPFDAETFGRGYFEETDWCQRALAAGFRHLVAANLFVEHKPGSSSFSIEERVARSNRNRPLFDARNPFYAERERLFRYADPLSDIRDLAKILVWKSAATGKRLLLTHAWGGGASDYVGRETRRLLELDQLVVTLEINGRDSRVIFQFRDDRFELTASPRTALDTLLGFDFDEVEIHALHSAEGLSALLHSLAEALVNRRYSVFFHDFLPLCPTVHLIDDHGRFCRIPPPGRCLECLHRNGEVRHPAASIVSWRQNWLPLLENAARLVLMDVSATGYIKKAFPTVPPERFEISPPDYVPNLPAVRRYKTGWTVNVGIVGRMTLHKGARVLESLMEHLARSGDNVTLTLFGEWFYPALPPPRLRVHGSYRPEQLPRLMADGRIHVALFPSICPETFSFTLSELFAMELPVVAYDLGSQGRRVRAYDRGIVCPETASPTELVDALRRAAAL